MTKSNLFMKLEEELFKQRYVKDIIANMLTDEKHSEKTIGTLNTKLKIIAYQSENHAEERKNWASYRIDDRVEQASRDRYSRISKRLRAEIASCNRSVTNKLSGKIIEMIGYKVI